MTGLNDQDLQCIIHLKDNLDEIKQCTAVSYSRIIDCAKQWVYLDNVQHVAATKLDLTNSLQDHFGYHHTCYVLFTSKRHIEQATKRLTQGKLRRLESAILEDEKQVSPVFNPKSKTLISSTSSNTICSTPNAKHKARSAHVLPSLCIICEKKKRIFDKHSKKRITVKLVNCESDGSKLLQAAKKRYEDNNDPVGQRILLKISDRDPVCLEVKYHKTCFSNFINCLYNRPECERALSKTFEHFCENIIENRLISDGQVFRLSKLRDLFIKTAFEVEGISLEDYRTHQLKKRLKRRYTNLFFLKESFTKSELVLYKHNDCNGSLLNIADTDDSEDEEYDADDDIPMSTGNATGSNVYIDSLGETRNLYLAALALKLSISTAQSIQSWPPTASDITSSTISDIVPPDLFNFIAWCTGHSSDIEKECVTLKENVKRKVLSICQDIIFLSSGGKKLMPKHVGLSMAVRHLTGSSRLINVLNSLGHCMSQSFTLEHDTALAHQQLLHQDQVPTGFQPGVFTTIVWDNNDFGEETLTGKGTTHNTNGIIIQRQHNSMTTIPDSQPRTRKRKLDALDNHEVTYYPRKREGPTTQANEEISLHSKTTAPEKSPDCVSAETVDKALIFAKYLQDDYHMPGWTGCNILANRVPPHSLHHIGYLPVIEGSPTQMSVVYAVLLKTLSISKSLNLETVVVVCDQALYAKIQDIRWQKKEEFIDNIIVRLGEFHTSMSFLAVIGKRFGDAGLKDVLIDAGVVAEGSLSGVMNGHHYNRSLRCHKLVYDALTRLQIDSFLSELGPIERNRVYDLMRKLRSDFPTNFHASVNQRNFKQVLDDFNAHVSKRCESDVTFAFWSSYIDLVELLLLFIRATREGNWKLHLDVIKHMLPWYFAYGRINYSRYLPVYLKEMLDLEHIHPDVHQQFVAGEFAVQRCSNQPFTMTACDQVIEQTLNRDSKTKGGMKGITLDNEAVNRWILSHASRAALTSNFFQVAGQNDETSSNSEMSSNRSRTDEETVNQIMETVKSFDNPFQDRSSKKLVHISSGLEADDDTTESYMSAQEVGKKAFCEFSKRLIEGTQSIFDPIKVDKRKSFADMTAKSNTKAKLITQSAKEDKDLFVRLLLLAQEKKIDLVNLMTYPLCSVPPALGHFDGSLRKTNKSALIKCLEKLAPTSIQTLEELAPKPTTLIIDGMALIHQQSSTETFLDFSKKLQKKVISLAEANHASRVDFVIDMYKDTSIKNIERERRSKYSNVVRLTRKEQKMPSSLSEFLGVSKNKEALLNLLWEEWQVSWPKSSLTLFMCHGTMCSKIDNNDQLITVNDVPELECDHEEADTRMFLHAHHAVKEKSQRVVIYSLDTDVIVIATSLYSTLNTELYVLASSCSSSRFLDIGQIASELKEGGSQALIGLHAFSGCDSISSFLGKGKHKFLSMMIRSLHWQSFFKDLGTSWEGTVSLQQQCEKIVCELYGSKELSDINYVRYNCFKIKSCPDSTLPPNRDSLLLHLQRANYQARIWRLSLNNSVNPPNPENHGWLKQECPSNENASLFVQWSTLPIAPTDLIETTSCSCQKSQCEKANCSCFKNKLRCGALCRCSNCKNVLVYVDEDFSDEEIEETLEENIDDIRGD